MQIDMKAENDDCHSNIFIIQNPQKKQKTTQSAENTEISSM